MQIRAFYVPSEYTVHTRSKECLECKPLRINIDRYTTKDGEFLQKKNELRLIFEQLNNAQFYDKPFLSFYHIENQSFNENDGLSYEKIEKLKVLLGFLETLVD